MVSNHTRHPSDLLSNKDKKASNDFCVMVPRLLYNPDARGLPMKIACFMSGSGTNVTKIIEYELSSAQRDESCPYDVVLIFTDVKDERLDSEGRKTCFAKDISQRFRIPYICNDIRDFYRSKGHKTIRNLSLRQEFDEITLGRIKEYEVDALALGGYNSIITRPLLDVFPDRIVNVHPADLSVMEEERRKYVGLHGVRDAILAGEPYIYSTTFIVRPAPLRQNVDAGEILMRSPPVEVWIPSGLALEDLRNPENRALLDEVEARNQKNLKERGDWVVFPGTLEMIARGRYSIDDKGNVYVDGRLEPYGFRL